jgi:hypothetical protein
MTMTPSSQFQFQFQFLEILEIEILMLLLRLLPPNIYSISALDNFLFPVLHEATTDVTGQRFCLYKVLLLSLSHISLHVFSGSVEIRLESMRRTASVSAMQHGRKKK